MYLLRLSKSRYIFVVSQIEQSKRAYNIVLKDLRSQNTLYAVEYLIDMYYVYLTSFCVPYVMALHLEYTLII